VAWLVRDGDVLATIEVAESTGARMRGLLGRDGIEGALLLQPAKSVHTLGMHFAIDVAYVDRELNVIRTRAMRPWRLGIPVFKAHGVIEAEAGSFARWDLKPGDQLEIKG
jgi:uncharacterized membrane protein (UPF0127 family)